MLLRHVSPDSRGSNGDIPSRKRSQTIDGKKQTTRQSRDDSFSMEMRKKRSRRRKLRPSSSFSRSTDASLDFIFPPLENPKVLPSYFLVLFLFPRPPAPPFLESFSIAKQHYNLLRNVAVLLRCFSPSCRRSVYLFQDNSDPPPPLPT